MTSAALAETVSPSPVTARRRRGLPLSLLLSVTVLLSCGPPSPRLPAASKPDRSLDRSDRDAPDDGYVAKPSAVAPAGRCHADCGQRIAAAEQLLKQAAEQPAAAAVVQYQQAGYAFIKAFRGCRLRAPDGPDRACPGAGQLLDGMITAYTAGKRDDGLVFAYLAALDPRWRVEGSELARKAPEELRAIADRIEESQLGDSEAAADPEAVAAAGYARLALEDLAGATRIAGFFQQKFGRARPDDSALLAAAVAASHADQGSWSQALAALPAATSPSQGKLIPPKLLWHGLRGWALSELGQTAQAAPELNRVLQLWQREGPRALGRASPAPMLGRERVVEMIGTAQFFVAEQQRLRLKPEALAMPAYAGRPTVEGVNQHIKLKVAQWLQRKQDLVAKAAAGYQAVLAIQPVPPPRWVAAAQSRIGELWAAFAADFKNAPMPDHVAADEELQRAWQTAHEQMRRELAERAHRAFTSCRDTARRHKVQSEHVDRCEQWLAANPSL